MKSARKVDKAFKKEGNSLDQGGEEESMTLKERSEEKKAQEEREQN